MSLDEAQLYRAKLDSLAPSDRSKETGAVQSVLREHPSAEVKFKDVQESTSPRALMALVK